MNSQQTQRNLLPSRAIADEIRNQIESGELAPGAQLPSERDLASTYGTARNTAREAVRLLAEAGLVITCEIRRQMCDAYPTGDAPHGPHHLGSRLPAGLATARGHPLRGDAGNLIAQDAGRGGRKDMTADQALGQAGKAQAGIHRIARAIARPGGMNINWDRVQGVVGIIGAITLLHGLKTRSWRRAHTATTVLTVGTVAAGLLKKRYARTSRTAKNK